MHAHWSIQRKGRCWDNWLQAAPHTEGGGTQKVMTFDKLFIDIGAESQEEAKGWKIGDPVSFDIKFARIGNDAVIGKAFDEG